MQGSRADYLWVATLLGGVAAVWVFLASPRDSAWQVGAFFVPMILAGGLLARRLRRSDPSIRRLLWLLLGAELGDLALSLAWYLVPVGLEQSLPFPSPLDGGFFLVYILYAAFLLMVLRRRAHDHAVEGRVALSDALILTLCLSAVVWIHVIEPNTITGASASATATAVLYPAFTLLLLGLGARLALGSDVGKSVPGALLLVWIGAAIGAAIFYGDQSAHGTFTYGSPIFVGWMLSSTALAALAAHPAMDRLLAAPDGSARARGGAAGPSSGFGRTVHAGLLLTAAVLPVVLASVHTPRSPLLLFIAVLSVVLVIYRTALVTGGLHSERALRAQLDEALERLRTQRDQLESLSVELERLALHDSVTGLGNRVLLRGRAAEVNGSLGDATLLLLDLDGFKEINDSLGHATGDALLREVGSRLGSSIRADDTVVRLGGDEFAIFLSRSELNAGVGTASRLLERLRTPFSIGANVIQVRGSIGVAPGTTAADLDELLRNADLAMYEAKAAGRDRLCVFDRQMFDNATKRLNLEAEMRTGLTRGEFGVQYQPIVDAESGVVRSVEALVRWEHPTRGLLPPSEFLPTAERTGLIIELGQFVLHEACEQAVEWRRTHPALEVAVNVSHRELIDHNFVGHVVGVLAATRLPAEALHLEVTETVLAAEDHIAEILKPLAKRGVRCSIDDFGTGHSSLSRLRRLHVDQLKIDRSFIAEITEGEPHSAPLLTSIIALAHSIGLGVVAEGVETAEQAEFLTAHGCDQLQGYLCSRPVSPEAVEALLGGTLRPPAGSGSGSGSDEQAVFPELISSILDSHEPLDEVLPRLLRKISELSGLECTFVTAVDLDAQTQITTHAYNTNPASLGIVPGLTVAWSDTVCQHMLEDGLVWSPGVKERYRRVDAVGIETYVTLPIKDESGTLCGTLCAASTAQREVDGTTIELMQLFAQAIGGRLAARPVSAA